MLRDSTTVRVITVVTLIYLPATFTATLLGMNSFFEMDDNRRIVVSPQFWIYIVCAVPLTVATLSYWWYFQKAKQRGERSMNGAISGAMMV
jgi:Mg2+ and Co2+ transporter CorA